MTEQQTTPDITEGNKLIAEFMGAFTTNDLGQTFYHNIELSSDDSYGKIEELKYHTSWDWLMPVVEKIENTSVLGVWDISGFSFRITRKHVSIEAINKNLVIYQTPYGYDTESKIYSVWIAVIEFIKWHKENEGSI